MPRVLSIIIFFFLFQNVYGKEYFSVRASSYNIYLTPKKNEIFFQGPNYSESIAIKKCSQIAIKRFFESIRGYEEKNIPIHNADSILVEIAGETISTHRESSFSRFIKKLPGKVMTLKKQINLLCKK